MAISRNPQNRTAAKQLALTATIATTATDLHHAPVSRGDSRVVVPAPTLARKVNFEVA